MGGLSARLKSLDASRDSSMAELKVAKVWIFGLVVHGCVCVGDTFFSVHKAAALATFCDLKLSLSPQCGSVLTGPHEAGTKCAEERKCRLHASKLKG